MELAFPRVSASPAYHAAIRGCLPDEVSGREHEIFPEHSQIFYIPGIAPTRRFYKVLSI